MSDNDGKTMNDESEYVMAVHEEARKRAVDEHRKAELALQTVICYDEDHAVHIAAEAFLLGYFK